MKTPDEVCNHYGLKYEPMKISFKKKLNLADLTPDEQQDYYDRKLFSEIAICVAIGLGFVVFVIVVFGLAIKALL